MKTVILPFILFSLALVLVCGCSECPECTREPSPVVTPTPIAIPTIEVLEFKDYVISRNPLTKTAEIEYQVLLDLPGSANLTEQRDAYNTEINSTAYFLQRIFFGNISTKIFDGYTVTRLKAHVTNNGQPIAEIIISGASLSDIRITRY